MNILKILDLLDNQPTNITYEYLQSIVIERIIYWIQLRLNTATMFESNYWDFINELYINDCFNKKEFKSLASSGNTDTNIRNIYFGDCREHEVLLHVLLKLYLKYHNLNEEYKIYKYYGYGTSIINSINNNEFWKSKKFSKKFNGGSKSLSSNRSLTRSMKDVLISIENCNISTWEHTHPLLYIESLNKVIALDALCHKTYLNPSIEDIHNVEILIEKKVKKEYSLWYNTLKDKKSKIYLENPTLFSKNEPFIIRTFDNKKGKIFNLPFNEDKLESSKIYNHDLKFLDLSKIPKEELFYKGINELCLGIK